MNSIHRLTEDHHRLMDKVLALHREALLIQNLNTASELLSLFDELLTSHIEVEDKIIFPLLDKHAIQSRWQSTLYYKEHEKISSMLASVKQKSIDLTDKQGRDLRREILLLLDYEKSFKGVLEHHTEREERALLPDLDNALNSTQLSKLIKEIEEKWLPINEKQSSSLHRLEKTLE